MAYALLSPLINFRWDVQKTVPSRSSLPMPRGGLRYDRYDAWPWCPGRNAPFQMVGAAGET